MSAYGIGLFDQHQKLLSESAITPEVARERGYVSVDTKTRLDALQFAKGQQVVPGLLIPVHATDGEIRLHQYRPDTPRLDAKGRERKYETPFRARMCLDVPPRARERIGDPHTPLWITEGVRKADAAVSAGLCCVALLGVDNWQGTNGSGGKTALGDWRDVALNGREVVVAYDSDAMTKDAVQGALRRLTAYLVSKGARVRWAYLPDGPDGAKVGLDDYLAAGHTVEQLAALASDAGELRDRDSAPEQPELSPTVVPRNLAHAHDVFRRWLGAEYDLQALDIVLATAAVERLGGDPAWLLVVSGSGNAKTETVCCLAGVGAHIVSTISGEAALLSGTAKRERAKDATGGLLRKMGARGLLVVKDFTSIISMNRDTRGLVLSALREVHDGRWGRDIGGEGGRSLTWTGRLVVIGATTTAYDQAHAVISKMGDRFALVRMDSTTGRIAAGRKAMSNVNRERQMRQDLSEAAAAVLAGLRPEAADVDESAAEVLLSLADVVTLARTAVEHDYRGDVIDAHAPEMPTRFAKMLIQVARGCLALGMDPKDALAAAVRVAGDSMPPLRLAVLGDVVDHPGTNLAEAVDRLQKPRSTVDRTLQALHIIGLLVIGEKQPGRGWSYRLGPDVDPMILRILITRNVSTALYLSRREAVEVTDTQADEEKPLGTTDISGYAEPALYEEQPRAPHWTDRLYDRER
ncbi:MAG TPA: DUF3854 domain-containing protein [Kribbellaceae bacterium]